MQNYNNAGMQGLEIYDCPTTAVETWKYTTSTTTHDTTVTETLEVGKPKWHAEKWAAIHTEQGESVQGNDTSLQ